jgi:chromosome partitioning protein
VLQLLDTVHDVQQFINSDLEIAGVLPTMYDGRTNHARAVLSSIEEQFELPVLTPPIPKSIRFAEAPAIGRTLLSVHRSHKGAEAYREVARSRL